MDSDRRLHWLSRNSTLRFDAMSPSSLFFSQTMGDTTLSTPIFGLLLLAEEDEDNEDDEANREDKEQVVEFLPSKQAKQQVSFSSLREDEQSNWRPDDSRPNLALAFPLNTSSHSHLDKPDVLLNFPNERPHKKTSPSTRSARQTPRTGEPRERVWEERTTWAH